jgi:methylmalonyl-CoA mutase
MSSHGDVSADLDAASPNEALWRGLALRALKGLGLETLTHTTADGIDIAPLYLSSQNAHRTLKKEGVICGARLDHPDMMQALDQAHLDIQNGAQNLQLIGHQGAGAYGFGATSPVKLAHALAPLWQKAPCPLSCEIDAGKESAAVAHALLAKITQGHVPTILHAGIDPLGSMALQSSYDPRWAMDLAGDLDHLRTDFGVSPVPRFNDTWFCADGRIPHNTGATPAQELAYALACGVSYLRMMSDQGITGEEAVSKILFRLSVDTDHIVSIAKLKAFRHVWARVLEASHIKPSPARLHGETSFRMMTHTDVHTNLIRTSLAVFSAIIGGVDALNVLPFTQALGLPEALARRLARNTALILRDEAHLAQVQDPTLGSGVWEAMTHELCLKAWAEFQRIEEEGGLYRSLQDDHFPARVRQARDDLKRQRQEGEIPLIGVDLFAAPYDFPVDVLAPLSSQWRDETQNSFYTLRLAQWAAYPHEERP